MKKIRIYTWLIVLSFPISLGVNAQQEAQFANVVNNPYIFNPAAGGMYDLMQLDLGYRNQWLASTGNPRTMFLTGHSQIRIGKSGGNVLQEFNTKGDNLYEGPVRTIGKMKHIVGGKFMTDAIGPFQKTSVLASYAFHLPLTKTLNAGLGLGFGWGNFQINPNEAKLIEADDVAFLKFNGQVSKQNVLDVQSGLVIYSERFYLGISGTQLLNNTWNINSIETGNTLNRHLFVVSSYRIPIEEEVLDLEPFVIIKGVKGSPISADIGARAHYNKYMWGGLQYRTGNSFAVSFGINVMKNFHVAYAFGYGAKKVRMSNAGTHEIQLSYLLGKNRNLDKEIKQTTTNEKKTK